MVNDTGHRLLYMRWWDEVREYFDEKEKDSLNAAIIGETVCPRGVIVDVQKMPVELWSKLLAKLEGKLKA